jgi:hypothetical protein
VVVRRLNHRSAGKQPVSLAIGSTKTAEDTAQLRTDIAQDLAALSAFEAKHGSFTEMVREHYADAEDD